MDRSGSSDDKASTDASPNTLHYSTQSSSTAQQQLSIASTSTASSLEPHPLGRHRTAAENDTFLPHEVLLHLMVPNEKDIDDDLAQQQQQQNAFLSQQQQQLRLASAFRATYQPSMSFQPYQQQIMYQSPSTYYQPVMGAMPMIMEAVPPKPRARHAHSNGGSVQFINPNSTSRNRPASNAEGVRPRGRRPRTIAEDGLELRRSGATTIIRCNECEAVFNRREHYNRHYRCLHAEEALHTCSECGKTCSRSDNLRTHILRVHGPSSTAARALPPPRRNSAPDASGASSSNSTRTTRNSFQAPTVTTATLEEIDMDVVNSVVDAMFLPNDADDLEDAQDQGRSPSL